MKNDIETETKGLAIAESPGESASNIVSLSSKMSTAQLKNATKRMAEQRQVIKEFVNSALVEGIDYGKIKGTSRTGSNFESKPTLFKPGMEKIFSLFGIVTEIERDTETLEMLGNEVGLVAYKCNAFKSGVKITEGRGAAKVGDMSRDANSTIKIAEKRARLDACLSLGFSEFFTQDMDDPDYRPVGNKTPATPKSESIEPITTNQRRMIFSLLNNTFKIIDKVEQKEVLRVNGYIAGEINRAQASELIDKMLKKQFNTAGYGDSEKVRQPAGASKDTVIEDTENIEESLDEAIEEIDSEATDGIDHPKSN